MKNEYLKWVTIWMSKAYKPRMRDAIKKFYDESANESGDEIWSSWVLEDPNDKVAIEKMIQEETLMLIEEAARNSWKFGDVRTSIEEIPYGGPMSTKTHSIIYIKLPTIGG